MSAELPQSPNTPDQKPVKAKGVEDASVQLKGILGPELRLPDGPLEAGAVRAMIANLEKNRAIRDYSTLAHRNQLRSAETRIVQEDKHAPAQQRVETAYTQTFYEYFPAILHHEFGILQQYLQTKKELGIQSTPELERLETEATRYVNTLTETLWVRVVLGNYNHLIIMKEEGAKDFQQSDFDRANEDLRRLKVIGRQAPDKSTGISPSAGLPRHLDVRLIDGRSQDPVLATAGKILNRDISWLLSHEKGVPGVTVAGASPLKILYFKSLSTALDTNLEQDKKLSPDQKTEHEQLKNQRERIVREAMQILRGEGSFDLEQIKKLTVHEAFGREYRGQSPKVVRAPESYNPKATYEREVDDRIKGMREHFRIVEEDVLSVGWKEKAETVWNEKGRFIAIRVAEQYVRARLFLYKKTIGRVEDTAVDLLKKLPLPEFLEKQLTPDERQIIMGPWRKELGLPEDFDILDPKAWEKLSPEDWERVSKKMQSTATVIEKEQKEIREKMSNVQSDFDLLQAIRSRRHPDTLVSVMPDDSKIPPKGQRITLGDFGKIQADDGAVVAFYFRLFEQTEEDFDGYSNAMSRLMDGFRVVGDQHIDMKLKIEESGQRDVDSLWRQLAILLGIAGGALFTTYLLVRKKGALPRAGVSLLGRSFMKGWNALGDESGMLLERSPSFLRVPFTLDKVASVLREIDGAGTTAEKLTKLSQFEESLSQVNRGTENIDDCLKLVKDRRAQLLSKRLDELKNELQDIRSKPGPQNASRLKALQDESVAVQKEVAKISVEEYHMLAKKFLTGTPAEIADKLTLVERAHAHGGPRPPEGWSREVLRQKMEILRGKDAAAKQGGIVLTETEANEILRLGLAGKPGVSEAFLKSLQEAQAAGRISAAVAEDAQKLLSETGNAVAIEQKLTRALSQGENALAASLKEVRQVSSFMSKTKAGAKAGAKFAAKNALNGVAIYFTAEEWLSLEKQLETENDPEKRAVLEGQKRALSLEAILTFMPGPAPIAAIAGGLYRRELDQAALELLENDKDFLAKITPNEKGVSLMTDGELLFKQADLFQNPGAKGAAFWTNAESLLYSFAKDPDALAKMEEKKGEQFIASLTGERATMIRAYLLKNTVGIQPKPGESKTATNDRWKQKVQAQEAYLKMLSPTLSVITPASLHKARLHAELLEYANALPLQDEAALERQKQYGDRELIELAVAYTKLHLTKDFGLREKMLADFEERVSSPGKINALNALKYRSIQQKSADFAQGAKVLIVEDLRPWIDCFEAKVRAVDSGRWWKVSYQQDRCLEDMQKFLSKDIADFIRESFQAPDPLDSEQYKTKLAAWKKTLSANPEELIQKTYLDEKANTDRTVRSLRSSLLSEELGSDKVREYAGSAAILNRVESAPKTPLEIAKSAKSGTWTKVIDLPEVKQKVYVTPLDGGRFRFLFENDFVKDGISNRVSYIDCTEAEIDSLLGKVLASRASPTSALPLITLAPGSKGKTEDRFDFFALPRSDEAAVDTRVQRLINAVPAPEQPTFENDNPSKSGFTDMCREWGNALAEPQRTEFMQRLAVATEKFFKNEEEFQWSKEKQQAILKELLYAHDRQTFGDKANDLVQKQREKWTQRLH